MKSILLLIIGSVIMGAQANELPIDPYKPKKIEFPITVKSPKKIVLNPEKYDAIHNSKFKGKSTLNYTLKSEKCIRWTISNVKYADLIDRLMSHNKISYKVYRNPNSHILELYLYIPKEKKQQALSIIEAAIQAKLLERFILWPH